jgi:amino acid adenylation domain-containing protein
MQERVVGFRLSPQQERVWLLQQENPVAYCSQLTISLVGELKTEVLRQAVARVGERHEILRTTFRRRAGLTMPFQVIGHAVQPPELVSDDLSGSDEAEQPGLLAELLAGEREQAWDYERGPLLRLRLIDLGRGERLLALTLPSLCADARTLALLVGELSAAYAACSTDRKLFDEPTQYVQFSEWQNELREAGETAAGRNYWSGQEWSECVRLPQPFESAHGAAASAAFSVSVSKLELDEAEQKEIEAAARERGVSAAVWLQACWQVLLWRLSGRPSEIIVGISYDGREYEELQQAIGLLAQTIPVKFRFGKNFSFSEVLEYIDESVREVFEWQEAFSWKHIGLAAADTSRAQAGERTQEQLFCAAQYEYEERQPDPAPLQQLAFRLASARSISEPFKLKLRVSAPQDTGDSLRAELHWDACALSHASARCLVAQLRALLAHSLADPAAPIAALSLLTAQERQRLLVAGNDTARDYPADLTVHELFEQQAARQPEAVAVVCEDEQLTYGELNERANVLAHHLRALGVGAESRVALLMERSVAMVAALLAVLKAGGAYVPLDASYPPERLSFMLADSGAEVLLTHDRLADSLPAGAVRVVDVAEVWSAVVSQEEAGSTGTTGEVSAANLAYIIYTSGSTGRPKGVMVEHRQLSNYLWAAVERLRLPASASYAVVSTLAADLGHTMTFPALCLGGQLHVLTRERASDAEALGEYFRRHAIDCLKIVPSHLEAVCGERGEGLPRLRLVLGGEAARAGLVERLTQLAAPECEIYNHYGPTETTVGAVAQRIGHGGGNGSGGERAVLAGLGQPLGNVRAYVLDGEMRACAVGEAGELYVGGAGVARGYLDRPELTAERFVPDVMGGGGGGGRLYRTGDVGRVQADGTIEFLGRIDHQIKIRGFRIEVGEIENALASHPSVSEAVVTAREDVPGQKRLIAYVVGARHPRLAATSELRRHLQERLPDYMVPTAFVTLDALPLTPNGKVDRRALPAPEQATGATDRAYVAPRTPVEEILCGIWAEVLGAPRVGVTDNFFELGGNSLLITQVISRVREVFRVELAVRKLFDATTITQLSHIIIENETLPGRSEKIARALNTIRSMPEEERRKILEQKRREIGVA